jgi:hypothetical protein
LGLIAGSFAHDFNNKLTSVIGNTELARMEVGEQHDASTYLASAEKTLSEASEIVKDLLRTLSSVCSLVKCANVRRS